MLSDYLVSAKTGKKIPLDLNEQPHKCNQNDISIGCRHCNKPIVFSDDYVSERSGRKIPLDASTEEPHQCLKYRKYSSCRNNCGKLIYFAKSHYENNGL